MPGTHIHNEAAYEAAIAAKIKMNAITGKRTRWFAADPSREALMKSVLTELNTAKNPSQFLGKMYVSFQDWGSLTEGQEAAVRKIMTQNEAKKAEWAAKKAEAASKSSHIGIVGVRQDFRLTVTFITGYETDFGYCTVTGFRDGDNVVIYKGQDLGIEKGETVTLKATVKAHSERDGVAQTIISRPKLTV